MAALSLNYSRLVTLFEQWKHNCVSWQQFLIGFGISDDRIPKRPAWSLHCKENAIAELETVEMECTFLRQRYRLVQITWEPWVLYTAKWEMLISICKTMRRPWSIIDMTWTLQS